MMFLGLHFFYKIYYLTQSCQNLEQAFQSGFDNFDTVRADPDLSDVHGTLEFDTLMEKWDPKRGFNPFGFFKKQKKKEEGR